jgi:cytochrome c biogenesis protein CcmG/thiol:disulfide interchange protein DsbE
LLAGVLGLAVAILAAGCSASGQASDSGSTVASSNNSAGSSGLAPCVAPPAGEPVAGGLPEVTLDCLGGGPAVKLSQLRGPLVINVWAQWCGPCREEAPYLAGLAKRAPGKVAVLGVDFADPRPELAIQFARDFGWSYPHLRDPDKLLGPELKLAGPPATVFVGADGVIRYVYRGPFTSQAQLDRLVADKLGVTL